MGQGKAAYYMKKILVPRKSSSLIVEHKIIIKYHYFTYVLQSWRHGNFGPQNSGQKQGGEYQKNGRIDHLNKYK